VRFDGPLHNQIPQPDRTVDNSTLWQKDYNRAHYDNMYFTRMAAYYERQSSGRYSVDGDVTEWVKVPFNEALYGRNYCGSIVCNTSKALVRDALAMWVDAQLKSGQTMAQITAYLKTFDQQDRYDIDGDGNFDEPDGVIDHFQIVHAGGDEAAGDPTYGTDAIWSHRSSAGLQAGGPLGAGVDVGSNGGIVSSTLVPNNPTGMYVYDYTMQPENGGLGVFAHEFGHDLGLPDLYDTSGNTGGAENSTAFWTLMSLGANIGDGSPNGIGDAPTDLGAWELLQLGWLQPQGKFGPFYDTAKGGERSIHTLGPNVPATKKAQALITTLPDKEIPLELGSPYEGQKLYYSGAADEIDTTMTKTVTLPASATDLTAQVRYNIEEDWDYAYLRVSADGGATFTNVLTNLSRTTDPNGQNFGNGITGVQATWTQLIGLGRQDGADPVPLLAGRRAGGPAWGHHPAAGLPDRRHPDPGPAARRRRDRHRVDVRLQPGRGLPGDVGHRDPHVLQRVHRREPSVRRLRREPEDGVQLRLRQHPAGLGGDLSVPERAADQLLGHLLRRQQRR